MNSVIWIVVGLRAAALALALSGDQRASDRLYLLSDLVEAGQATDAHMAQVAEILKSRTPNEADFDAVLARIAADSARLQEPLPLPTSPV